MSENEEERRGVKGRFEGLADIIRKAISQGAGALADERTRETLVAEVVRKAISVGSDVVDSTEDQIRKLVNDLPLPKEAVERITGKLDELKDDLFRMLRDEVHGFLERIDLGAELQKILTSLSFEIVTEVRFIPNDKASGKVSVRPDAKVAMKVKRTDAPAERRRSKSPPRSRKAP